MRAWRGSMTLGDREYIVLSAGGSLVTRPSNNNALGKCIGKCR